MAKKLFPDGTEVAGFYVRTIRSGPFVFVSGTPSLDSKGRVRGKNAAEQTTITIRKIEAGLKSAGARLADLARTTIYVTARQDTQGFGGHVDPGRRQCPCSSGAAGRNRGDGSRRALSEQGGF